ncbi:uncharacterized protein LOC114579932 [Dendrobium catenatum]|uniref:uncharacterized protein LOC114579932 n=1 Tax=Dendrobium catenatum TaxID=906689 RepID=UPI00109F9028|nr:uncharacterized protein LOC114579932 [Dendrobium catenatum]
MPLDFLYIVASARIPSLSDSLYLGQASSSEKSHFRKVSKVRAKERNWRASCSKKRIHFTKTQALTLRAFSFLRSKTLSRSLALGSKVPSRLSSPVRATPARLQPPCVCKTKPVALPPSDFSPVRTETQELPLSSDPSQVTIPSRWQPRSSPSRHRTPRPDSSLQAELPPTGFLPNPTAAPACTDPGSPSSEPDGSYPRFPLRTVLDCLARNRPRLEATDSPRLFLCKVSVFFFLLLLPFPSSPFLTFLSLFILFFPSSWLFG